MSTWEWKIIVSEGFAAAIIWRSLVCGIEVYILILAALDASLHWFKMDWKVYAMAHNQVQTTDDKSVCGVRKAFLVSSATFLHSEMSVRFDLNKVIHIISRWLELPSNTSG